VGEDQPNGRGEQSEIGFIMDLTQFDELERKIVGVIERLEKLNAENVELRNQISSLEGEIRRKVEENEQLAARREELLSNQKDVQKEELIRQKVADLLQKLNGL